MKQEGMCNKCYDEIVMGNKPRGSEVSLADTLKNLFSRKKGP